jgi:hypothetical protein
MSWRFNPMSRGDLNIDPVEQEFFATETLDGITDALVREAIQNSLDAATQEMVSVRFCLGRADDSTRAHYLDALWPHLLASHHSGASLRDQRQAFTYLVVEDMGTRGLEGDPDQYQDDGDRSDRNDFYYFWRNVGRSRKESNDRGRWGLGKTVFAAASRLNSFFGLTLRRTDRRFLLMGQSVLRIHQIAGARFRPYGYYGNHQNDFCLPIDAPQATTEFARRFELRRERNPGLSIVVPFPDEEISTDSLLEAVVRHYFQPLLSRKLEVEIEHSGQCLVLKHDNLQQEIRKRQHLAKFSGLIELAHWGMAQEPSALATLAPPPAGRAPKLSEDLFDATDLQRLRRHYDDARRIGLDVKVMIAPAGDRPRQASFRVLMERDPQEQRGEGCFVRQGITIENPGARRRRGVRWILMVTDPLLSAFLGDAENPAHTEWQRSSPKFKAKYDLGPSTLDFVRSLPANLATLLSHSLEGRDPDLLREVFSIPTDSMPQSIHRPIHEPTGSDDSTIEVLIPATLGANGSLVLAKVKTGFRLRGHTEDEAPHRIEVLAAYDVLRGNPFARYSPLDFRMDKSITVQPRGARILLRESNRLVLELESSDFDVLVTRFDEKRDLRVKVREIEEAS